MPKLLRLRPNRFISAFVVSALVLIILNRSVKLLGNSSMAINSFYKPHPPDTIFPEWKVSNLASNRKRLCIFFGTRSEIIKLAPLILEVRESNSFLSTTVYTGQDEDSIKEYIRLFNISVDIWFKTKLEGKQSINKLFGEIVLQADQIQSSQCDIWIIQGDTTTALAIATVAFHKQVTIAHVEAGLRTFNMYSPHQEQFNRKTIASIATYNFAQTTTSAKNLINEGIDRRRIFVTGNTVIDAAKYVEENQLMKKPSILESRIIDSLLLVTLKNFNISDNLYKYISMAKCETCTFLVPVHPNPLAGNSARKICRLDKRFLCVGPLPYGELHWVLKHSKVVLTDSGGIQEEVTWYNTPTIILRNITERRESIESGIATQIGDIERLPSTIDEICRHKTILTKEKRFHFGNGNAARKILDILSTKYPRLMDNAIIDRESNVSLIINSVTTHSIDVEGRKFVQQINAHLRQKRTISVAVILQVFKRNSLSLQLESVTRQTLKPSTVVIVQNGNFVNVSGIITDYRRRFKDIEFHHIASSKNLRFHGRFHIAFLQEEDYVSVWDDDIYAQKDWLQFCVDYSKTKNFSVVGASGRTFHYMNLNKNKMFEYKCVGRCDFVIQGWTMPRKYLIFYLASEPLTRFTGEDIQIAFVFQKQGIQFFHPPGTGKGNVSVSDLRQFFADKHASWLKVQAPRKLLFCTLLQKNFQFLACKNCNDEAILRKCVDRNKINAEIAEADMIINDRAENKHAWS